MNSFGTSTKDRIIEAAFSFFTPFNEMTISLGKIAQKVGISKTAIYRHFKSKEELLQTMTDIVYTKCAECFKSVQSERFDPEKILPVITRYFTINPQFFAFIFSAKPEGFLKTLFIELAKRDVDIFKNVINEGYIKDLDFYVRSMFVVCTLMSPIADFIRRGEFEGLDIHDEKTLDEFVKNTSFFACNGIGDDFTEKDFLNVKRFDSLCEKSVEVAQCVNPRLVALSKVIATKGLSGFTVEAFAEELGLAKSSLYAFFEARDEMIHSLINEEILNLLECISENIFKASTEMEKVYILIQTEFKFFQKRPESLEACRWKQLSAEEPKKTLKQKLHEEGEKMLKVALSFFDGEKNCCIDLFSNRVFVSWLLTIPIALHLQGRENNFSYETMMSTFEECFYLVERGLKYKKPLKSAAFVAK